MIRIIKMTKSCQAGTLSSSDAHRGVSFPGGKLLPCALLLAIAAGNATAQEPRLKLEEITVSGTRVMRDGFESPTPVSVLGREALDEMGVTVVADAINRLPAISGSVTTRNASTTISGGSAGVNTLSLRGLGPNRTLTLLNGKRVVTSQYRNRDNNGGAVDTNEFPSGLIERVEVVTGGASAAYGSDALAGVVNFIIDTDYTGFKANVQGGITGQGDGKNLLATVTAGIPFAGGRGHFLFSGERATQDDIPSLDRDWGQTSYALINNPNYTPDNGQPRRLTAPQAGLSVATRGGLIVNCPTAPGTACPLRGTQFLEGGVPASFKFGSLISGPTMVGGDWEQSRVNMDMSLQLELERDIAYSHVRYDINDSITAYGTMHWAHTQGTNHQSAPNFNFGNVTVLSGNPFIPDSVQARMTANGIPSFSLGTMNTDVPNFGARNDRTLKRYVAGLEGTLDVLDTAWRWDAYYTKSIHDITSRSTNNMNVPRHRAAIDAVLDGGQVVCSINADADPTNDDSACSPYNPMGKGVNSQLAVDYVAGFGWAETLLEQDVMAMTASGEPFSTWAGPVSVAFGLEHRRETLESTASDLDEADSFLVANYHGTDGKYDVTEGFIETVVPLANDQRFAKSLDLNAALRSTNYSTSGKVETWKVGMSWAPVDDVRFRFTRSRDIRAPYLGELFDAGLFGAATPMDDPFTGTSHAVASRVTGNPNLRPEEADTTGAGVVFTPSFLPEFAASIDYYSIDIEGAIGTLGRDGYVNRCFEGDKSLCNFIDFDENGAVEFVHVQPANVNSQSTSGLDVELSYRFPLSSISSNLGGDLSLRALATFVDSLETIDTFGNVTEGAGVNADRMGTGAGFALFGPDFRYLMTASYDVQPVRATLTMRGIGSGVYNNKFLTCTSNCPTSTPERQTITNNHVDAVTYFDLALNYTFGGSTEVFFVAENLLDEDPPLIASSFVFGPGNSQFYNGLGRMLRAGVRVSF